MDVGGLKPILPILADRCWDGGQADGKGQYWSRLKQVCVFQEQGNVTSLDFLPHSPYHLASTSRNRLTIFDTSAQESMCFHSRFKSPLYAASFRQDGSLIGVATHGGHVHFFDATMRKKNKQRLRLENPIRSYHAHRCRVNSLAYSPSKLHFITSGDDGRVKLWDLGESTSERPLWKCHGHQDQVRECKFAEANENIIVTGNSQFECSGSYDHTVMMWDMRSKPNSPLLTLQHDDPVEKLLLTSKDRIVITASKRLITFWDLTAGGKILHRLENHHKTVTSLCVASSGKVLLSGGLDRRINGFRLETGQYELVYSLKTASPVLALAVSGDDQFMAYGMSSLLALYQRNSSEDAKSISLNKEEGEEFNENDATTERSEGNPVAYSFEHTTRQRRELPLFSTATQPRRLSAPATIQSERSMTQTGVPQSRVVELTARQLDMVPLGRLDNMLRQKTYKELVRTVVRNTELVEKHPEIGVSAFNQLIIRQKLYTALAGHGGEDLARIIHFLRLHLFKAPFFDVLHQVANVLIKEEVSSEAVDEISHFKQDIESEVQLRKSIGKSLGAMGTILAASIDISRQTSLPASKKERKRDDESTTIPRNNGVEEGHHLTNGC